MSSYSYRPISPQTQNKFEGYHRTVCLANAIGDPHENNGIVVHATITVSAKKFGDQFAGVALMGVPK